MPKKGEWGGKNSTLEGNPPQITQKHRNREKTTRQRKMEALTKTGWKLAENEEDLMKSIENNSQWKAHKNPSKAMQIQQKLRINPQNSAKWNDWNEKTTETCVKHNPESEIEKATKMNVKNSENQQGRIPH